MPGSKTRAFKLLLEEDHLRSTLGRGYGKFWSNGVFEERVTELRAKVNEEVASCEDPERKAQLIKVLKGVPAVGSHEWKQYDKRAADAAQRMDNDRTEAGKRRRTTEAAINCSQDPRHSKVQAGLQDLIDVLRDVGEESGAPLRPAVQWLVDNLPTLEQAKAELGEQFEDLQQAMLKDCLKSLAPSTPADDAELEALLNPQAPNANILTKSLPSIHSVCRGDTANASLRQPARQPAGAQPQSGAELAKVVQVLRHIEAKCSKSLRGVRRASERLREALEALA